MAMSIFKWADIKDDGWDAVIIGNGASIAVSKDFSYASLYEKAREKGLISAAVGCIFNHFKTDNFEKVLEKIACARVVNKNLGLTESQTEDAYNDVKKALGEIIHKIHPKQQHIQRKLSLLSDFMAGFETVISLNYDLIVYWAALIGNAKRKRIHFADGFNKGKFDENWEYFKKRYRSFVAYPHGNFSLRHDFEGNPIKIKSVPGLSLLEKIEDNWSWKEPPLFVAEGDSNQKMERIYSSQYLSLVYNEVLKNIGGRVVVYGWGMGDSDQHIFNQVFTGGKVDSVAISVLRDREIEGKTLEDRLNEVGIYKVKFFYGTVV